MHFQLSGSIPREFLYRQIKISSFFLRSTHFLTGGQNFPVQIRQFAIYKKPDAAFQLTYITTFTLCTRTLLCFQLLQFLYNFCEDCAFFGECQFSLGLFHEEVLQKLVAWLHGGERARHEKELWIVDSISTVCRLKLGIFYDLVDSCSHQSLQTLNVALDLAHFSVQGLHHQLDDSKVVLKWTCSRLVPIFNVFVELVEWTLHCLVFRRTEGRFKNVHSIIINLMNGNKHLKLWIDIRWSLNYESK